ncbi:SubName: Full=Uncharacterized protein {ECO:0000313/EMBL:CCA72524.1} [Serendipita indica DSM 11827]|uniref:Phosphatidylinositol-specific phospholipase C X domain-containing protein n=1 Tax=Serendipita indica (strain DSM 11827) TaxID=1109443 RepID=G4TMJ0_SERID|nr:SubName: Full=Uncharacterized protein {ECO:0000313/EMBL:CCA72524.1} [Serendipita indica DSM 11827]CCA72524.1 hypothetical protein PIIN_06461 [Serendipita indica DSM 11827]
MKSFALAFLSSLSFVAALDSGTMQSHLSKGAELLGTYKASSANTTNWMSTIDDATLIQNMNIPGTHDSLTWNVPALTSPFTQTQELSLFDQLNYGARFVDLRIGLLDNKIRMYHSSYLLDETAELEDIFWGMYYWLDQNPTETVLVSVKVDNGNNTAALQQQVYTLMNSPDVADYWVHNFTLPTLGESRHKLIPILRLGLSSANIPDYQPFGINVGKGWLDNKASFFLTYVVDTDGNPRQKLYVEDLYNPDGSDQKDGVNKKMNAITDHLTRAANAGPSQTDSWYIAFASGYNGITTTPKQFALGSTLPQKVAGVNQRMLSYLVQTRGNYYGVIVYDFIGMDQRLISATLGWETSGAFMNWAVSYRLCMGAVFAVMALLHTL